MVAVERVQVPEKAQEQEQALEQALEKVGQERVLGQEQALEQARVLGPATALEQELGPEQVQNLQDQSISAACSGTNPIRHKSMAGTLGFADIQANSQQSF